MEQTSKDGRCVRELEKEEWGSERIPAGYDVDVMRCVMQGGAYADPLSAIVAMSYVAMQLRCSALLGFAENETPDGGALHVPLSL